MDQSDRIAIGATLGAGFGAALTIFTTVMTGGTNLVAAGLVTAGLAATGGGVGALENASQVATKAAEVFVEQTQKHVNQAAKYGYCIITGIVFGVTTLTSFFLNWLACSGEETSNSCYVLENVPVVSIPATLLSFGAGWYFTTRPS